ncbi:MAG: TraR/DksA family transcriptional regulator [Bryobacterales bacterium]|nr:TraR/DksA family transcriptional regulator [Bryobacterales bacterium]
MTRAQLNALRKNLEADAAALERELRSRDGIVIERAADTLDEVQNATARELEIQTLDVETGRLREVRAALRRMAEGTYGICVECEEEISEKRLNAVPWTARCIACQSRADAHRAAGDSYDEAA